MVHLVESQALSRMATICSSSPADVSSGMNIKFLILLVIMDTAADTLTVITFYEVYFDKMKITLQITGQFTSKLLKVFYSLHFTPPGPCDGEGMM